MKPRVALPGLRHARSPTATTSRSSRGSCCAAAAGTAATPISVRYPFIELLTGVLFAAVGARFAHSWALPAYPRAHRRARSRSRRSTSSTTSSRTASCTRSASRVVSCSRSRRCVEHDWGAFGRALLGAARSRSRSSSCIHLVVAAAAWASATSASRSCSGLSLGWLGWGEVAGGLFAGFLYGAVDRRRADRGQGRGAASSRSRSGPFLAAGSDDVRAVRRADSSTGTGTSADSQQIGRSAQTDVGTRNRRALCLQRDGVVVDCCR